MVAGTSAMDSPACVWSGVPIDKLPDVVGKAAVLGLHRQEGAGIGACAVDLQAIAHYAAVQQHLVQPPVGVAERPSTGSKVVEQFAVALALAQIW